MSRLLNATVVRARHIKYRGIDFLVYDIEVDNHGQFGYSICRSHIQFDALVRQLNVIFPSQPLDELPSEKQLECSQGRVMVQELISMIIAKKSMRTSREVGRFFEYGGKPASARFNCIKEGHLQKRGHINTAFRKRWFALKAGRLYYFKSEKDQYPAGMIDLKNAEVELASKYAGTRRKGGSGQDQSTIMVTPRGEHSQSYVLMADSEAEKQDWFQAIRNNTKADTVQSQSQNSPASSTRGMPQPDIMSLNGLPELELSVRCRLGTKLDVMAALYIPPALLPLDLGSGRPASGGFDRLSTSSSKAIKVTGGNEDPLQLVGRTETIENCADPQFQATMLVPVPQYPPQQVRPDSLDLGEDADAAGDDADASSVCSAETEEPAVSPQPPSPQPSSPSPSSSIDGRSQRSISQRSRTGVTYDEKSLVGSRGSGLPWAHEGNEYLVVRIHHVQDTSDEDLGNHPIIAEAWFTTSDLHNAMGFLDLDLEVKPKSVLAKNKDPEAPQPMCSVRLESVAPLRASVGYAVQTYLLQDVNSTRLHVEERMEESPLGFAVPQGVLHAIMPKRRRQYRDAVRRCQESSVTAESTYLMFDDSTWQQLSERVAERGMFEKYAQKLNSILSFYKDAASSVYTGYRQLTFKPSTRKKDPMLRMIPTNLHLQQMSVWTSEGERPAVSTLQKISDETIDSVVTADQDKGAEQGDDDEPAGPRQRGSSDKSVSIQDAKAAAEEAAEAAAGSAADGEGPASPQPQPQAQAPLPNLKRRLSRARSGRMSFRGPPTRSVYLTTTVGAPTAFSYGFHNQGLSQMLEALEALNHKLTDMVAGNPEGQTELQSMNQKMTMMLQEIELRADVCCSQALSALVATLWHHVYTYNSDVDLIERFVHVGFLVHWESLLSTHGHEIGMIGDMHATLVGLQNLRVRFVHVGDSEGVAIRVTALDGKPIGDDDDDDDEDDAVVPHAGGAGGVDIGDGSSSSSGSGRKKKQGSERVVNMSVSYRSSDSEGTEARRADARLSTLWEWSNLLIEVEVGTEFFDDLPQTLQDGHTIPVVPVMFTQGINEQQNLAIALGNTGLQDEINQHHFLALASYFKRLRKWAHTQYGENTPFDKLVPELEKIEQVVAMSSKREKNVDVLTLTERFARKLGAGRITSCKSAKDRTSMSVTAEQASILAQTHKLPEDQAQDVANIMRLVGVRRENVRKNIGKGRYAFNSFQRMMLPDVYKAPKPTLGGNVT